VTEHTGVRSERALSPERLEPFVDADVSLLLRSHGEHGWLSREVVPVLTQLEAPTPPSPAQLYAARAYLEVAWAQAQARAHETDAARARLHDCEDEPRLSEWACRYHAGVRELRARLAARVSPQLTCASRPR
jgi:hypothetical protein